MATLQFTVFADSSNVLLDSWIQQGGVSIGAASTQSTAVTAQNKTVIRRVRLIADADCFVIWGTDPTAVADFANGMALGAENPEVVGIASGNKIAVIERV